MSAELLLVTHEHGDHNNVAAIGGDPRTVRSTAGTFDDVVAIASEHDDAAGTGRGPNTIFRFQLGDTVLCHFGDFGQSGTTARAARGDRRRRRPLPAGRRRADGRRRAARRRLCTSSRRGWWCRCTTPPMRNFLDPPDAFLAAVDGHVTELDASELDTTQHAGVVVLKAP